MFLFKKADIFITPLISLSSSQNHKNFKIGSVTVFKNSKNEKFNKHSKIKPYWCILIRKSTCIYYNYHIDPIFYTDNILLLNNSDGSFVYIIHMLLSPI